MQWGDGVGARIVGCAAICMDPGCTKKSLQHLKGGRGGAVHLHF